MSAVKFLSRKATRRRTAPATLFSGVTTQPTQSAAVMYGGQEANAVNYAFPGSLVLVGRDNYNFQVFKDISAAGGTVLIYIDALVDNAYGPAYQQFRVRRRCLVMARPVAGQSVR
jgi:hypothetical protein